MGVQKQPTNTGMQDAVKTYSLEDVTKKYPNLRIKHVGRPEDKVAYMKCAGMDVHKKILVVAACITDPATMLPNFYTYKLNQTASELEGMMEWLKALGITDVCMESTGKYSLPLFRTLEQAGFKPVMANPKYVRQVKGQKTDERDAIHIAQIFRVGLVTRSFIPDTNVQDLRDVSRYRRKLVEERTREKNRLQNALVVNGVRLGNVLTDVFGKTGTAIISYLATTPQDQVKDEAILKLVDKKCKHTPEEILDCIHGFHFSEPQKVKINTHLSHIQYLDNAISEAEKQMHEMGKKHFNEQIINLMTIPDFKELSALSVIGEVGIDMSIWDDAEHFISWCGVCPANNSSAGKKKSTKIGLGGQYLKPVLVECALNASKSKQATYFSIKYWRIATRRGKKKAAIAIARMMLESVYYILRDGVCFCPKDEEKVLTFQKEKDINHHEMLHDIFKTLRANGVDEETMKKVMDECAANAEKKSTSENKEKGS